MKSKLWRQILSLILSLILVLELVPASVLATGSDAERGTATAVSYTHLTLPTRS